MFIRIHPTAQVAESAEIGDETQIWLHRQIREGAVIGAQCVLGKTFTSMPASGSDRA